MGAGERICPEPMALDRWHIAQNVRTLVCDDEREHRRIIAAE